jgi:hypothetical protein
METDLILAEANKIIDLSTSEKLRLRLMGASAVRLHSPSFLQLYDSLGRPLSDLDFAAFNKDSEKIERIMSQLGYSQDRRITAFHESQRNFFFNEGKQTKVDIFFDKLSMCHTIDFKGRLDLDDPTITVSDILLEKMQIVQIAEKDLKDIVILFRAHEIKDVDNDAINFNYISKILANDWGFWYTFTSNLDKVTDYTNSLAQLSSLDKHDILTKVTILRGRVEKEPKSFKWKMRARVGSSVKWYNEVEDLVRK